MIYRAQGKQPWVSATLRTVLLQKYYCVVPTMELVNIVTQCNELSLFKYSRPIRVRHFTMARFQNKNKRLQRISDENGPLKHLSKKSVVCNFFKSLKGPFSFYLDFHTT